MNQAAFRWGRRAAIDLASVEALIKPAPDTEDRAQRLSRSFEEMVARRVDYLTAYQNAAYAARYRALVERARADRSGEDAGRAADLPRRSRAICSSSWPTRTSTRWRGSIPTARSCAR